MKTRQELFDDQLENIRGGAGNGDAYVCSICGQIVPVSQVKSHLKVCLGNKSSARAESRPGK